VCEYRAPGANIPLSKLPSDAVTVWGAASSLTQVTVPPTRTVTLAGPNAEPFMDTVALAGAAGAAGVVPPGDVDAAFPVRAVVVAFADDFFATFFFVVAFFVAACVAVAAVATVAATVAAASALAATTTVPVIPEWKSQT
jgi:hypothetical protein